MSGSATDARHENAAPTLPSQVVQPGHSSTPTQQASTQPGDGSNVGGTTGSDGQNVVEVPAEKPTFKDQFIGYAQKTRGTVLNKPDLKEQGDQLVHGAAHVSSDSAKKVEPIQPNQQL
ncbi:hypothetical protein PM082_017096 [Marasmius tenuissimus]|nr:hypothetical protein PM082_017096 [Marasmius tenuissimus]